MQHLGRLASDFTTQTVMNATNKFVKTPTAINASNVSNTESASIHHKTTPRKIEKESGSEVQHDRKFHRSSRQQRGLNFKRENQVTPKGGRNGRTQEQSQSEHDERPQPIVHRYGLYRKATQPAEERSKVEEGEDIDKPKSTLMNRPGATKKEKVVSDNGRTIPNYRTERNQFIPETGRNVPKQSPQVSQKEGKKMQKENFGRIIGYILKRHALKNKSQSWSFFKQKIQALQQKTDKLGKIFSYSIYNVYKSFEKRQKQIIFHQLKDMLSEDQRQNFSTFSKSEISNQISKKILPNLLFRTVHSQYGEFFRKFCQINGKNKDKHGLKTISKLFESKEKQFFSIYFSQCQKIKNVKPSSTKKIYFLINQALKTVKQETFHQILSTNLKVTTTEEVEQSSVSTPIRGVLCSTPSSTKNSQLSKVFQEEENNFKAEEEVLFERILELKDQEKEFIASYQYKQKINQELKQIVANLSQVQDKNQLGSELQDKEPTRFAFLKNIYIQTMKKSDETINLSNFFKDTEQQQNLSVTQPWRKLHRNLELKTIIEMYEQTQQKQRQALQNLSKEHQKLSHIIRDYIRERYLWSWVCTCISHE